MIYLFHGTDKTKARRAAHKVLEAAEKKHKDAAFFKLSPENWSADKLDELVGGQGLFYSGFVVFADHLFDEKESGENLLKKLKDIAKSPNFFVFLEGKLNKKELETFEKYSKKIENFDLAEKKLSKKEALALKGEKIDFFEFTDALGDRNKKLLWTLYQDALGEGVPSEEVHGILFWQVKSMLLAALSKDAAEVGMKDYPYSKARSYAKKYGVEKLQKMSTELLEMYHEAHRGKIDFAVALEKFVLEL
ncbi:MAG: hypothetical protein WCO10_00080 [bacterium]